MRKNFAGAKIIISRTNCFADKTHHLKQSEGVVSYVKLLYRSNAVCGRICRRKNHNQPHKLFRRQGAPPKAKRRRSFLRQAALQEQRRMRKNLQALKLKFGVLQNETIHRKIERPLHAIFIPSAQGRLPRGTSG